MVARHVDRVPTAGYIATEWPTPVLYATHCKQFWRLRSLLSTHLEYHTICGINALNMRLSNFFLHSFHCSLLYTFSCHSSPPTIVPSSLTSSCHLFLGLPHGLVDSKFIYSTLLGILFSSILCTCSNQRNLCSLIVCVTVNFLTIT
jgi:hypothetical protein